MEALRPTMSKDVSRIGSSSELFEDIVLNNVRIKASMEWNKGPAIASYVAARKGEVAKEGGRPRTTFRQQELLDTGCAGRQLLSTDIRPNC